MEKPFLEDMSMLSKQSTAGFFKQTLMTSLVQLILKKSGKSHWMRPAKSA